MENNYILTSNGELYHWGVKGMKWGVRRYQNKNGTLTAAGKKRRKSQQKELSPNKKERIARKKDLKNRRTMSDAELKKKIERLKMEKEFKNLTNEDIRPGRTYVKEIMSSAGKKTLTIAAAGALAYGVKAAMTKEFDLKEAANYIAANPNKKK